MRPGWNSGLVITKKIRPCQTDSGTFCGGVRQLANIA
jgi:hypothetical protein